MAGRRFRTAFILGAGLGTRLRPLTETTPKPLLHLAGRPIITYAMDHLVAAGVDRFIVNTHHCPEAYGKAFPDSVWRGVPIIFSHEPVLLDTGGGLKNIENLLAGDEAIICYNGDVLTTLPLGRLLLDHETHRPEVTMALRSAGPLLNVEVTGDGVVCDLRHTTGTKGVRSCLFTGVYTVEVSFLRHLENGRIESVIDAFLRRIGTEAGVIRGTLLDDGEWDDIGSPETYFALKTRMEVS